MRGNETYAIRLPRYACGMPGSNPLPASRPGPWPVAARAAPGAAAVGEGGGGGREGEGGGGEAAASSAPERGTPAGNKRETGPHQNYTRQAGPINNSTEYRTGIRLRPGRERTQ